VGQAIGTTLQHRGFRIVVIEQDQRIVRSVRSEGMTALVGNASNRVLLDHADLLNAALLVVAVPDALASRLIVDYARDVNPDLDVLVRTHRASDLSFFRERGVGHAVMGELELSLEMTRYALHRFGVSGPEIQSILRGLRERMSAEEPA
jgi:CPA2 family monovalent cation:H+ antiporter-2